MSDETISVDEAFRSVCMELIALQDRVAQLEADLEELQESMKEPKRILTFN